MRTKRVPVPQAIIASMGEKRNRPYGKVFEELPVIPCPRQMDWGWDC